MDWSEIILIVAFLIVVKSAKVSLLTPSGLGFMIFLVIIFFAVWKLDKKFFSKPKSTKK
ncbi:MAG: hypothetical protein ABIF85_04665 [Nanoarchaeota archaeon]|nr:hypothetical protein [Nanoarchaeota archaeon]MBU4301000.1 hypothetical protein [Nanoarchaeota archaeon]MBU4452451.1 hypothetical protein [Nanoarchaeota archaeon]MCG2723981.1 hypothetical protein [archaeon]